MRATFYDPFRAFSAALCLFLVFGAAPAFAVVAQLTDDTTESGCGSFAASASDDGGVVAFESTCDLSGDNEDGNREIFTSGRAAQVLQITDTSGCASTAPVVSGDGSTIAFESDCDLDGSNPDFNVEIWLWEMGETPFALTDTFGCSNLAPAISASGDAVAFDSDCVSIEDLSSEILVADANRESNDFGDTTQLTDDVSGLCDSLSPDIAADGSLVVFESDCDHVGDNEDLAAEIFSATLDGTITKLTTAPDDTCASFQPAISGDGSAVVFQSDCDFVGENVDGGGEIFAVTTATALVTQLSDDPSGVLCETLSPALGDSANLVTYESTCNPLGLNDDESSEIFQVGSTTQQITEGEDCNAFAPSVASAGVDIFFDTDCDTLGSNADGSFEVMNVFECNCGSPSSRGGEPRASDALFILKVAVGTENCLACECDIDASGAVTASDALDTLRAAVGQNVSLMCPEP